ncbi:MAG: guanine deaminase [Flavobacteriaceae bacterium]
MSRRIVRARILSFGEGEAHTHVEDGALALSDGVIEAAGSWDEVSAGRPDWPVDDHRPHLVVPGFIDPHIHFPQTQVIASYGAQLLEWLQKYTFVEEQKFADPAHADRNARFFCDELLRAGTTTAVAFCSVHPQSAESLFAECERRGMRMVAGKVMMDRNAPAALTDTAASGYAESRALIERWHGRGRLGSAIAPRFAITSTPEQLAAAGRLAAEFPDCHVETHLSENLEEIRTAASLYPEAADYTDIYDRHGLLGPKTLLGHCIHLSEREVARLAETDSVAVFCPTSNLFIGSGLFDLARMRAAGVRVALATDVGGGTSYSMLATLAEAYKVLQLRGQNLPALEGFRMITRGNAEALGLEGRIGSLAPGIEADLVVLDSAATPAMAYRMETARTLEEELFLLMTLGDDRAVRETYVAGIASKPSGEAA